MSQWKKRDPIYKYKQSDSILEKLRCVNGIDDLHRFLNPSHEDWIDPYLLSNIEEVSNIIIKAIQSNRKIYIYADCDSDGISSASIAYNYIRQFTENVEWIYTQRSEGHGVHNVVNKDYKDSLLIAVDSSTSESDACKFIKERNIGCDIAVIDHHPPTEVNEFATIVNPYLSPNYPNKVLSGSAMVLKVISVIDDTLESDTWANYFDLAAIGLVGDMMSLRVPENRFIVHKGLSSIKNLGLYYMFKKSNKDLKKLTATDISFTIAPLLNGSARLQKIEEAIASLTETDDKSVQKLVRGLIKSNNERKLVQKEMVDNALKTINNENKIAILLDSSIGKGYAGLVASDLANKLKKPVMVGSINEKGNYYSGSYRGYAGFNVKELFENLEQIKYLGGHNVSGGWGCFANKLEYALEEINDALQDTEFEQTLYYDLEIDAYDITREMIYDVMKFSRIAGMDIPEPKFLIKGLTVLDRRILGEQMNTVKLECDFLDALKFRTDQQWFEDECPQEFDEIYIVGSLLVNEFYHGGKKEWIRTNQCFLEDIRVSGGD